jgi:hypothetical protein
MKLKKNLFVVILTAIVFFVGSPIVKGQNAQKNVQSNLVGKWKIDKSSIAGLVDDIIEKTRKQDATQADALSEQRELIEQTVGESLVEYKADNIYTVDIPGRPQATGKWKISDDGKKIIRTDNAGKEIINEVVESTKTKLVVINTDKRKVIYNLQ